MADISRQPGGSTKMNAIYKKSRLKGRLYDMMDKQFICVAHRKFGHLFGVSARD